MCELFFSTHEAKEQDDDCAYRDEDNVVFFQPSVEEGVCHEPSESRCRNARDKEAGGRVEQLPLERRHLLPRRRAAVRVALDTEEGEGDHDDAKRIEEGLQILHFSAEEAVHTSSC